jgi:hypothetical protein
MVVQRAGYLAERMVATKDDSMAGSLDEKRAARRVDSKAG